MNSFLHITKALSDKNRVRVLLMLKGRELCVCQIIEVLGLAPSTVSKHLSILLNAGLIASTKNGRWVYYALPARPEKSIARAISWAHESLADDPAALADRKKLNAVKKMSLVSLCSRYKKMED